MRLAKVIVLNNYLLIISFIISLLLYILFKETNLQHEAAKVMQDALNSFRGTPEEVRLK